MEVSLTAAWSYSLSSLEFLELGSSSANLTGSLPQGNGVNSDPIPISLPNGFPFSNETESTVFVSFTNLALTGLVAHVYFYVKWLNGRDILSYFIVLCHRWMSMDSCHSEQPETMVFLVNYSAPLLTILISWLLTGLCMILFNKVMVA